MANYSLEAHSPAKGWVQLVGAGVNGGTIGHRVVDVFEPVFGCDKLRWRCTAAGAGTGTTAHLVSFSAHVRHPIFRTAPMKLDDAAAAATAGITASTATTCQGALAADCGATKSNSAACDACVGQH